MLFDMPQEHSAIIKVIGIGGGGCNAVNHMFRQGIRDVNFVICNTDAQALESSPVPFKVQLGPELTKGRGAGSHPEMGKEATLESMVTVKEILAQDTEMVFITAGMGGGTGTGGAPVVAKIAREMGVLTVGIVTLPFGFEGKKRVAQAHKGIAELTEHVDSIIVIVNDKIREVYGNLSFSEAFSRADDILTTAAKGIAEIITIPGYVNVDFEDVKTVLSDSGVAIMGTGTASGEKRAIEAVEAALNSPLLNDTDICGARHVLLNITSGQQEVTMDEISEITEYVQEAAGMESDIIWGNCLDEEFNDELSVTVIATGFEAERILREKTDAKPKVIVHSLEDTPPILMDAEIVKPHTIEPVLKTVEQAELAPWMVGGSLGSNENVDKESKEESISKEPEFHFEQKQEPTSIVVQSEVQPVLETVEEQNIEIRDEVSDEISNETVMPLFELAKKAELPAAEITAEKEPEPTIEVVEKTQVNVAVNTTKIISEQTPEPIQEPISELFEEPLPEMPLEASFEPDLFDFFDPYGDETIAQPIAAPVVEIKANPVIAKQVEPDAVIIPPDSEHTRSENSFPEPNSKALYPLPKATSFIIEESRNVVSLEDETAAEDITSAPITQEKEPLTFVFDVDDRADNSTESEAKPADHTLQGEVGGDEEISWDPSMAVNAKPASKEPKLKVRTVYPDFSMREPSSSNPIKQTPKPSIESLPSIPSAAETHPNTGAIPIQGIPVQGTPIQSEGTSPVNSGQNSTNQASYNDQFDQVRRSDDERRKKLRGMSLKLNDVEELEKTPAYLRRNVPLNDVPHSSEDNVSRYHLGEDDDDEGPEFKRRNSFLHDNVD
ncbi:MAG: cell division protein FtsZ [Limisphaerales bacterium]|jgi:cell division protein FtsZ